MFFYVFYCSANRSTTSSVRCGKCRLDRNKKIVWHFANCCGFMSNVVVLVGLWCRRWACWNTAIGYAFVDVERIILIFPWRLHFFMTFQFNTDAQSYPNEQPKAQSHVDFGKFQSQESVIFLRCFDIFLRSNRTQSARRSTFFSADCFHDEQALQQRKLPTCCSNVLFYSFFFSINVAHDATLWTWRFGGNNWFFMFYVFVFVLFLVFFLFKIGTRFNRLDNVSGRIASVVEKSRQEGGGGGEHAKNELFIASIVSLALMLMDAFNSLLDDSSHVTRFLRCWNVCSVFFLIRAI